MEKSDRMMKRKKMNKKIVSIFISMLLCVTVSAVTGTEIVDENEMLSCGLAPTIVKNDVSDFQCQDNMRGLLGKGKTCYAFRIYPDTALDSVSFETDNPGTLITIGPMTSTNFIAGGTWVDGIWYGCEYASSGNSNIWTIDEMTGVMTLVGASGSTECLNGLAYDGTTLYGAGGSYLYTIDMATGVATQVGSFNTGGLMIGIACDSSGNLYGEDLKTDCLYSIDKATGAATLIGSFGGGIDLNWAQDMAIDKESDICYLAAFTQHAGVEGALYTCDLTTGIATKVGQFGTEITEVAGFAIPYTLSQPPDTPERPEGPIRGKPGVEYTYTTTTTDPDGDQVYYRWSWGDGTYSKWLGPYSSGTTVSGSHSWSALGTYDIQVKSKDIHGAQSDWSDALTILIVENDPPNKPNITGQIKGKTGVTYLYIFVTTDPDGDEVSYYVDWGDGNISGWKGPYDSGEEAFATHSWSSQGIYAIKVKAKDTLDDESDWGTLEVTCL